MNKVLIMAGVVVAAATAACGPQPATTGAEETAADTPSVTVALPAGDVGAGRQAFMELKCTTCHAVAVRRLDALAGDTVWRESFDAHPTRCS